MEMEFLHPEHACPLALQVQLPQHRPFQATQTLTNNTLYKTQPTKHPITNPIIVATLSFSTASFNCCQRDVGLYRFRNVLSILI